MSDQLTDEALELLRSAAVATIVTLNADGSPHPTVAWIGLDGDEIVFGTLNDQRKLRNLRRSSRGPTSVPTSCFRPCRTRRRAS